MDYYPSSVCNCAIGYKRCTKPTKEQIQKLPKPVLQQIVAMNEKIYTKKRTKIVRRYSD